MRNALFFTILLAGLFSCADKYQVFRSRYQFKSADGNPDYSNLDYWAAHPWKWDPSDSVPMPFRNEPKDSAVDVFFLHPTTYTGKIKSYKPNAAIDDDYINAKTDYSSILYQASAGSLRQDTGRHTLKPFLKKTKKKQPLHLTLPIRI